MIRRSWIIYGALIGAWGLILGWQAVEHFRVRKSARVALVNRAVDISNTLGLVMRSQRRFGVVSRERVESAMQELVKPGELDAIALLNASGEVVASVGASIDFQAKGIVDDGEHWEARRVTLITSVDLSLPETRDQQSPRPTIVVPRQELLGPSELIGPPLPNLITLTENGSASAEGTQTAPRPPPWMRLMGTNSGRQWFRRPLWTSEEEYKTAIQKQGVHSFVTVISTQSYNDLCDRDLWLRAIIGTLATISVAGLGLAWRSLGSSSELQIRLVRASELTSHLKDMNLAAAGLAHETRNPLNIIRGLAQMISKQNAATPEIRKQSLEITEKVDRVTAQLNEFINYSRPREVRQTAVNLAVTTSEVLQALSYDIEEKKVRLQNLVEPLTIEADEQLLRQALFNLVLNAIQAVEENGEIQVRATRRNGGEAAIEVCDNGSGVPLEHRAEIFKPYFTMTKSGTGLGLAVVQHIVLGHGWEIDYIPNEPKGAIFRITHLKLTAKR